MTTILHDYDPLLYAAGFAGEKRSIHVVHNTSGDEYEFDTRSDFYGHYKKKAGGWLAEYNKGRASPLLPNEFTITDIQTPEPVENCIHTLNRMIKATCEVLGADNYYGYTGKGEVFRHDVATILKYKGNRDGMVRPIHLEALKQHVVKRHAAEVITGIEADDACCIDSVAAWKKWKKTGNDKYKVILSVGDKDYNQIASHLYNPNISNEVCSYDGFGWLKETDKGITGRGRLWLYFQCASSDASDNYSANSASTMRWGDKSAYKVLGQCRNDKQALEGLVKIYKTLYPQPKQIIGWRGDFINIDWLYVMKENFTLARMLRWEGDNVDVQDVLNKLRISYE